MLVIQNYADQKLSAAVACLVSEGSLQQRIRSARSALAGLQVNQVPPSLHFLWRQVMLDVRPEDMTDAQAHAVVQALTELAREVPCWVRTKKGWEPGLNSVPVLT
jgi:hypothetical protein